MAEAAPAGHTSPPSNESGGGMAAVCNLTTATSSSDQHGIDIDTTVWGADEVSVAKGRTPKIHRVPHPIKNNPGQKQTLSHCFTPSLISIGPYHYNIGKGPQEGQKLKQRHAQKFIEESEQKKADLFLKIKNSISDLRDWYDDQGTKKFDDSTLATIFLLDGCFLLNFINCSSKENGFADFDLTNHEMTCIKQDLFLLENQIPFKVLRFLFVDAEPSSPSMEEKIRDFVASHVPFPRGIEAKEVNRAPHHLLHYLQGFLLGKPEWISPPPKQGEHDKRVRGQMRSGTHWNSCRNVQELMKVGIYFKPSSTNYLTDISFKPHWGTSACLMLPAISMNTSTMIMFLNLIASESANNTNNLGVISFLCFLDSLIDRWDDVKELQAAGVLRNFVGERGDVAQFFNIACSKLVPNPSAYRDVIQEIENHVDRHYDSKSRKWYVQCKQKYFSSPWSFIALIAAITGLSLTAIQAFTSVFPL